MSSVPRQALGRGLGSLIPRTDGGTGAAPETVDIDLIVPNPQQPRLRFEPQALEDLAASIREHGVIQPVVVTRVQSEFGPTTYQLIAGERRLQAARLAGLERIPVVVREAAGAELLELALIENLQRSDLNPLEEAQAFKRLYDDFNMTQEEIAKRVGRSRAAISNTMRLLLLEEDIRTSVASGHISEGHARALLAIEDSALRLDAWRRIISDEMSVRQAEEVARALRTTAKPGTKPASRDAGDNIFARDLEDTLRRHLGSPVSVRPSGSGGRIVIRYHSQDELDGIVSRIVSD